MENIPIRVLKTSQKEPDFSENFSIRDVQDMLAGKDMVQELHRHDFYFILVLQKGAGTHEIDFLSYEIVDNSIFFMRPGQVHQLTLKAGSTGFLMAFKTDFYHPQLLRKVGNSYQPDVPSVKKLLSILTDVLQEYTNKPEAYQKVIHAHLDIFFIELIRQGNNHTKNANTYQQERLEEFLALLEKHIASHKQVSQYAEMLNLSLYQLNAITKSTLGKTGSDLINEYIILEAKRYLLATTNQVTQIADHLGYEDVSYFIRFFKKHTGFTPEAFRHKFS